MATYIVGDVQGCYASFQALLKKINFDEKSDRVHFVGDLVNRGPGSLQMLRWAVERDAVSVLGNHDLYCLAVHAGAERKPQDTLTELLEAPDRKVLMDWLRHSPLIYRLPGAILVHGGFDPRWQLDEALKYADQIEQRLRGPGWREFVRGSLGTKQPRKSVQAALACLTRIRMCTEKGVPAYGHAGTPETAPAGLTPWFLQSPILGGKSTVYFGHWAALGHRFLKGAVSLDAGCVWGRELLAIRLEDQKAFAVPTAKGDTFSAS